MPNFGVTGHVHLTAHSKDMVYEAVVDALRPYAGPGLTGVSCLAPGADTVFARAVLKLKGRLVAVVPARDYRTHLSHEEREVYDELLRAAGAAEPPAYNESGPDAYAAANRALVEWGLDRLYAIWDGIEAPGRANTASVVAYARACGIPVEIIWPDGAERGP
jgi:hypothetical protein